MELPKNITQIGEADKYCRIYVEDYVVSYIKQMNGMAQNKDIAIALYGKKTVEDGVAYLFAYGAGQLNFLHKPVRHLSQAQEQEIEKLRKKHFPEMSFLGYQVLNGEMVEGFQICEQDICRYVGGYARFYEKNDSMLAYMLENRNEEAAPEKVDREKYEAVRKRQEVRRQHREPDNVIPMPAMGLRRMKIAATGVFVLLCVVALALMRQESTGESLEETARQAMSNLMEQKIPDEEQPREQVSTLVAEDKLEEALRQENARQESTDNTTAESETGTPETEGTDTQATAAVPEETVQDEQQEETAAETEAAAQLTTVVQPTAYIIEKGDTLIGISMRNYGNNRMVSEICALNGIADPDDIKIGQEIILP